MPYRLVKGEFHLFYKKQKLVGSQPDGDSVWFKPDDRALLSELGIAAERIVLIAGSGVDVEQLRPLPEPPGPITLGFVGRLLADKGIRVLVAAHRLLRAKGLEADLIIAGTPDPANPASVSQSEAESWTREPGVSWLGHVDDDPRVGVERLGLAGLDLLQRSAHQKLTVTFCSSIPRTIVSSSCPSARAASSASYSASMRST